MKLVPLSTTAHGALRWKKPSFYTFAARERAAPVVLQEMPAAAMAMPLGFLKVGNVFEIMAVMGLEEGKNLFVADNGRWIGGYVPAVFRSHPFHHARTADGKYLLAVDEDSGLISPTDGEPFFEDGKPTKAVEAITKFMEQLVSSREAGKRVCEVLQKHDLIQPWPIKVNTPAGEKEIGGLFCVDEAKLNALSTEAFEEIRKVRALAAIYCQLISMQNIANLRKLGAMHMQAAQKKAGASPKSGSDELDLSFLDLGPTTGVSRK